MATKIDELRAIAAEAHGRADAAQMAGDDAAEARAIDEEAAIAAELSEALTLASKLGGGRLMRAHRAAARAGAYQIGTFDLRSRLPQLEDARFPGSGVVLFRSPDLATRKRNEIDTTEGSGVDANDALINMICACTLEPAPGEQAADLRYRAFWETDGRGLLTLAGLEIAKLGGFQLDAFKRVSK